MSSQCWIKLHASDNDRAAVVRLSLATRAIYYALQLYTMTHCDTPGVISRRRRPIATTDMALEIRIAPELLDAAIEELAAGDDLIERRDDGIIRFLDWNQRQSGNALSLQHKWRDQKRKQRAVPAPPPPNVTRLKQ